MNHHRHSTHGQPQWYPWQVKEACGGGQVGLGQHVINGVGDTCAHLRRLQVRCDHRVKGCPQPDGPQVALDVRRLRVEPAGVCQHTGAEIHSRHLEVGLFGECAQRCGQFCRRRAGVDRPRQQPDIVGQIFPGVFSYIYFVRLAAICQGVDEANSVVGQGHNEVKGS